jgi:pyruvate dehydrogenase E2 component (dihydrolipoamide acetyltransferase)
MATKIFLPRLGESITEAVVGRWLKNPGDVVKRGEVLAELETAKAMMELESPVKGTLLAILSKVGETVYLDNLMAVIGMPGEEWLVGDEKKKEAIKPQPPEKETHAEGSVKSTEARFLISPNAKRLAHEKGISADQISRIKKAGRVTAKDIKAIQLDEAENISDTQSYNRLPLNNVQMITARRMSQSAQSVPQFSITVEWAVDALVRFVNNQKAEKNSKITITAVLAWITGKALLKHPRLNSRFDSDAVLQYKDVNIAVAVATQEGLFVPVIQSTQNLSLHEIAAKLEDIVEKAKNHKLGLDDIQGGTFTISNLGMKGVTSFIPLIDPDQAAILGVGAVRDGFIWDDNHKELTKTRLLNMTLSADHRVVGGAEAADFLITMKDLIEKL